MKTIINACGNDGGCGDALVSGGGVVVVVVLIAVMIKKDKNLVHLTSEQDS